MDGNKKGVGLTAKIFAGLISGLAVGICLHYFPYGRFTREFITDGIFYILGNGFLRLMQMLVVPLVFTSLVCGSSSVGDTKALGKIGVKTMIFYFCTTACAITLALVVADIINPGTGLDMSELNSTKTDVAQQINFKDTLLNIVPVNPVAAMAEGNMLQIILFAVFVGLILTRLGEKAGIVSSFFRQFNCIMMEMTSFIMHAAPIGVFCLVAKTFAEMGIEGIIPIFKYVFGVYIALIIHCIVVYMPMFKFFTGLSPIIFIKKFFPVMGFAFSTASSNAAIPMSIEYLSDRLGISTNISSFTVPLGATINMDGTAIMQGIAVVFAAQAYGIELGISEFITVILTATLASVGTAGVPGMGTVMLSMVFSSINLPIEAIGVIMGIDRIVDMARTTVNVTGDAVCTAIVSAKADMIDKDIFYS